MGHELHAPYLVQGLESEFKTILGAPADLETWSQWLQSVVNKALTGLSLGSEGNGHGLDAAARQRTFTKAARQFLLKWSFYRYSNFVKGATKMPNPNTPQKFFTYIAAAIYPM